MTTRYKYQTAQVATKTPTTPTKVTLSTEQTAGHGDHWRILSHDVSEQVPSWLRQAIDTAAMPTGLNQQQNTDTQPYLLLSDNQPCHINQILAMLNGKPQQFVNAYPCVNSPYGLNCKIERIIVNEQTQDAVLRLVSEDGSVIYAFDQIYTVNHDQYQKDKKYYVNLSAWAYQIQLSDQDEVVRVEDPDAIRYHRAFNDIVAANNGIPPEDIAEQIKAWQPDSDVTLAPVEINLGHMCAYLFGETFGQEDEAWCQGQVLGMQTTTFFGQDITLMDVVILREPDADPFVVRMATPSLSITDKIAVHDYIQANIWLQAAVYSENQQNDA
ncbi:hypothetical protein [Psychrobacter sp. I-STPA10]|uniref:hypothetical protein n=1 Tax=Psychrobacter sp. I-STPA10 TaxID=2585769 RepID=UPI001E2D2CC3|nr:hypothetical protein [Psychrobacter sp. I-STPA10]